MLSIFKMSLSSDRKPQAARFLEAAREAYADITKEEFARVIGGLAKPQAQIEEADEDKAADE